ncbi:6-phosphogluconolactonase [Leadbetterella byssophila DSM 17132]|uniref:6-phosphogluconolactonase n=1 Tax=Leadbetterella byssophila (strain DSM 17132 / JCM 16389 / KACC 11308 / NBRC 106382 / 4M15) TaxID=649349 RepID=E4RS07_LEAB4|nr:lactonase family protein [Leadbetterella byssophila]ADQ18539.1 6-phosphogluconolactonase [Leadbetterella byssophila DSM 17132]
MTTFILSLFTLFLNPPEKRYKILVGTYTDSGSEGIYLFSLAGNMNQQSLLAKTNGVPNPSFLAYEKGKVFAVNELEDGKIQSYALKNNKFEFISEQSTNGAYPCHLSYAEGQVFVANYGEGSFLAYKVNETGAISLPHFVYQNKGTGPVTDRQEKAHMHSVTVHGKELWAADLGTDEVLVYSIPEIKEVKKIKMTPGSGPRHITFHKSLPLAYVINELNNTITVVNTKTYQSVQEISTLPKGFSGTSFCADIHFSPDQKYLYGSNRYSDGLARFKVDAKTGLLSFEEVQSVEGKVPRNFAISPDGKWILVANQDSNDIVIFERNTKTGKIKFTGNTISIPKPVFVKFIEE